MSARKRALKREHRDAIRKVASPAGVRRYHKPEGSPIAGPRRPTLGAGDNPLDGGEPAPRKSGEGLYQDFLSRRGKGRNVAQSTRTADLRAIHTYLDKRINKEVDPDRGDRHSVLPAFQAETREEMEDTLATVDNELHRRGANRDSLSRSNMRANKDADARRGAARARNRDRKNQRLAYRAVKDDDQ